MGGGVVHERIEGADLIWGMIGQKGANQVLTGAGAGGWLLKAGVSFHSAGWGARSCRVGATTRRRNKPIKCRKPRYTGLERAIRSGKAGAGRDTAGTRSRADYATRKGRRELAGNCRITGIPRGCLAPLCPWSWTGPEPCLNVHRRGSFTLGRVHRPQSGYGSRAICSGGDERASDSSTGRKSFQSRKPERCPGCFNFGQILAEPRVMFQFFLPRFLTWR